MMQWSYVAVLMATLVALSVIDRRYNLVWFADAWRACKTLASGVFIFSVWDLLGIHYGIFFSGHSPYALDWFLLPNYPIEELFFLIMLCYLTLLVHRGLERRL